jgi:hypothetical protein
MPTDHIFKLSYLQIIKQLINLINPGSDNQNLQSNHNNSLRTTKVFHEI